MTPDLCVLILNEKGLLETILFYVGPVVSWGLIIGGWFFVDKRNNGRETRKETREIVSKTISKAETVKELGIKYHVTSPDSHDAFFIKSGIQIVSKYFELLKELGLNITNSHIIDFRKSITKDNFDTSGYIEQPYEGTIVQDIQESYASLALAIETAFKKKYN